MFPEMARSNPAIERNKKKTTVDNVCFPNTSMSQRFISNLHLFVLISIRIKYRNDNIVDASSSMYTKIVIHIFFTILII